jgi:hypothetical protein
VPDAFQGLVHLVLQLHCVLGDVQWTSPISGVRLRSLPVVGPPINVYAYIIIVLCSVS